MISPTGRLLAAMALLAIGLTAFMLPGNFSFLGYPLIGAAVLAPFGRPWIGAALGIAFGVAMVLLFLYASRPA